jgi:hypothetical protein
VLASLQQLHSSNGTVEVQSGAQVLAGRLTSATTR